MAVGGLHDISMLLGRLDAQSQNLLNQTQLLFEKFDELQDKSSQILSAVDGLKTKIANLEEERDKHIMPSIRDYRQLKQRGIGLVAAAGLFGGGMTALIPKLVKLVLGE